jgi:glyoxylase-like metal-dependent hydrolase (beta-lactamase superfamily II)
MGFDWTHPSDCNVYLIESNGELALIDSGTGDSVDHILSYIESIGYSIQQLKKVILTHIHADHAGGASELKKKTGAKVYVHERAAGILTSGDEEAIDLTTAKRSGFYPAAYTFKPCEADHLLKDDDIFSLGNLTIKVVETPGHSRFDLSFITTGKEGTYLFSGDTVLFGGKISMINSSDFNLQDLSDSVKKLTNYSCDLLLPGHNQPALKNGHEHIAMANKTFSNMGIPPNIN